MFNHEMRVVCLSMFCAGLIGQAFAQLYEEGTVKIALTKTTQLDPTEVDTDTTTTITAKTLVTKITNKEIIAMVATNLAISFSKPVLMCSTEGGGDYSFFIRDNGEDTPLDDMFLEIFSRAESNSDKMTLTDTKYTEKSSGKGLANGAFTILGDTLGWSVTGNASYSWSEAESDDFTAGTGTLTGASSVTMKVSGGVTDFILDGTITFSTKGKSSY